MIEQLNDEIDALKKDLIFLTQKKDSVGNRWHEVYKIIHRSDKIVKTIVYVAFSLLFLLSLFLFSLVGFGAIILCGYFAAVFLLIFAESTYNYFQNKVGRKNLKKNNLTEQDFNKLSEANSYYYKKIKTIEQEIQDKTSKITSIQKEIQNKIIAEKTKYNLELLKSNFENLNIEILSKILQLQTSFDDVLNDEISILINKYTGLFKSDYFYLIHHQTKIKYRNYYNKFIELLNPSNPNNNFTENNKEKILSGEKLKRFLEVMDELRIKDAVEDLTIDPEEIESEDKETNTKTIAKSEKTTTFTNNETTSTDIPNTKELKNQIGEESLFEENKKDATELEEARLDQVFSKKAEESERKEKLIKGQALAKEPKKDYIGDAEQRQEIGLEGELFIIRYEEKQFMKKGREDLAKKIEHISLKYGDSYGYDILSFDEKGNEKYIEVKTTIQGIKTNFYMSDNEYQKAISTNNYFIYRVYDFDIINKKGKFYPINTIKDLDKYFKSKPITYQFTPPKF